MTVFTDLQRDYHDLWQSAAAMAGVSPTINHDRTRFVFHHMVGQYLNQRNSSYKNEKEGFIATREGGRLRQAYHYDPTQRPSPQANGRGVDQTKKEILSDYEKLWRSAATIANKNPTTHNSNETTVIFRGLVNEYLQLRGCTFADMKFTSNEGRLFRASRAGERMQPAQGHDILNTVNRDDIDRQTDLNNVNNFVRQAIENKKHLFALAGVTSYANFEGLDLALKDEQRRIRLANQRAGSNDNADKLHAIQNLRELIRDGKLEYYINKLEEKGLSVPRATPQAPRALNNKEIQHIFARSKEEYIKQNPILANIIKTKEAVLTIETQLASDADAGKFDEHVYDELAAILALIVERNKEIYKVAYEAAVISKGKINVPLAAALNVECAACDQAFAYFDDVLKQVKAGETVDFSVIKEEVRRVIEARSAAGHKQDLPLSEEHFREENAGLLDVIMRIPEVKNQYLASMTSEDAKKGKSVVECMEVALKVGRAVLQMAIDANPQAKAAAIKESDTVKDKGMSKAKQRDAILIAGANVLATQQQQSFAASAGTSDTDSTVSVDKNSGIIRPTRRRGIADDVNISSEERADQLRSRLDDAIQSLNISIDIDDQVVRDLYEPLKATQEALHKFQVENLAPEVKATDSADVINDFDPFFQDIEQALMLFEQAFEMAKNAASSTPQQEVTASFRERLAAKKIASGQRADTADTLRPVTKKGGEPDQGGGAVAAEDSDEPEGSGPDFN
jgi:hypothetical protein